MAKFDVIVDCSAVISVYDVEAETQKEANDKIEKLIFPYSDRFLFDHMQDCYLCDPVVYRDNEDEEE